MALHTATQAVHAPHTHPPPHLPPQVTRSLSFSLSYFTAALLLLYSVCFYFTTAFPPQVTLSLSFSLFTAALVLLYHYCTSTLLLLYCCFSRTHAVHAPHTRPPQQNIRLPPQQNIRHQLKRQFPVPPPSRGGGGTSLCEIIRNQKFKRQLLLYLIY